MNPAHAALEYARRKGVRLWLEQGELRYQGPKGALTREEVERLRISKSQIVALLEENPETEATEQWTSPARQSNRSPLAFSQLARWHTYQSGERRVMRQVASATRLRGRLHVKSLRESVAEVTRAHEALRARIIVVDGIPLQEIAPALDYGPHVDDLTMLSESEREPEAGRIIESVILERIDLATGPLFAARLIKLRDDEHLLLLALEHMIADGYSLGLLTRDLFAAYVRHVRGRPSATASVSQQFADYALSQRSGQQSFVETHRDYWDRHLAGCQRLRFPQDRYVSASARAGYGFAPVRIDGSLKAKFYERCRKRRTTLAMSAFTAYAALVLRWCHASDTVVQYQSDSRVCAEIENTIGFFASALYVRVAFSAEDTFADLAQRITGEFCRAHEHADFSFLAAQGPAPEFTRNTTFNWVPQGSRIGLPELDGSGDALECSTTPLAHLMLRELHVDQEPGILLYDTEEEIVGGVQFPVNRFSSEMMERFARSFLTFFEATLTQPEKRIRDVAFFEEL